MDGLGAGQMGGAAQGEQRRLCGAGPQLRAGRREASRPKDRRLGYRLDANNPEASQLGDRLEASKRPTACRLGGEAEG